MKNVLQGIFLILFVIIQSTVFRRHMKVHFNSKQKENVLESCILCLENKAATYSKCSETEQVVAIILDLCTLIPRLSPAVSEAGVIYA